MKSTRHGRASERGAVTIKTLLTFFIAGAVIFSMIKIIPVYTEQRQVIYDVDELANKTAVRSLKEGDVKKAIEDLRLKYDLPENSIKLDSHAQNSAKISLSYTRAINFIVTTYTWKVDHKAEGKAI